jgi:Leucine-rich repeat (LRR) protein
MKKYHQFLTEKVTSPELLLNDQGLTRLPKLDPTLEHLECWNNKLRALPNPLPPALKHLNCRDNELRALPPLPSGLEYLCCGFNDSLKELPTLPSTLKDLRCFNNGLTTLPPLPPTITIIFCQDNKLTQLPPLPEGLKYLQCTDNKLTTLPPLPKSLETFLCGRNQIVDWLPRKFWHSQELGWFEDYYGPLVHTEKFQRDMIAKYGMNVVLDLGKDIHPAVKKDFPEVGASHDFNFFD